MTRTSLVLAAVASLLGACVGTACPEGAKAVGGRCVPALNSGTGGSDMSGTGGTDSSATGGTDMTGTGGADSNITGGADTTGAGGTGGTNVTSARSVDCEGADLAQASEASDVQTDTTWSGVVHVTGDVTVDTGATLTIEAGTVVVVDADASIEMGGYTSRATLIADGTEASPITFCGAQATKGFWGGLALDDTLATNSVLRYVTVADAGGNGAALSVGSAIMVDHVTVLNSGDDGVQAAAFHSGSSDLSVADCDGRAVVLLSADAISTLPVGGTFTGNTENVIALSFDTMDSNVTFHDAGIPYVQEMLDVQINSMEVTFEAGVTYQFGVDGSLEIGDYVDPTKLIVSGTADAPVTFEGKTHEKGLWSGIVIKDTVLTSSSIKHARITDGGGISAPLDVRSAILIQDVEFDGNASGFVIDDDGLKVGSANVSVTNGDAEFVATVHPNGLPTFPAGGTFTNNAVNEIEVLGTDVTATIKSIGTVPNPGIPYFIAGDLWMEDGSDWSIAPGTEFIMEADVTIQVWPYVDTVGFVAVGTATEPIVFRGREDQVGYWTGIDMRADVTPETALDYVEIHNAGKAGSAALTLGGPVSVTNCTVTDSAGYGIQHDSADSTDYTATNSFSNTTDGAVGVL